MFRKSKYRSSKLAVRKKRILIWRISLVVIFIVVLFIGISFWSKHEAMQIIEIDVSELSYVNEDKVQEIIFEKIEGSYFGILSKSNSIIYPRSSIREKLFNEFPSIKDIDLDFKNFKKISVEIEEFIPIARWCNEKECYFLNDQGYIFVREPLIHTSSFITFKGYVENGPIRSHFLNPQKFNDFLIFAKIIKEDLDIDVIRIEEGEKPIFNIYTKQGARFLIDGDDDLLDSFKPIMLVFFFVFIYRKFNLR